MKKILLAGAAIGALFAGSASAADLAVKAPILKAPPPSYSWTGCYVDAGAGYGVFDQEHNFTNATTTSIDTTTGGRGWLGRFGGGCDYQLGAPYSSFVIGAFGDYDFMNLKGTLSTQLINAAAAAASQGDEKESSAWYVGGRVGYLITPTVLTYFDGGYTQTRFNQIDLVTPGGVSIVNSLPAHTYGGWFLGSGFEYQFTWFGLPNIFLRTEYRYASYNRDDLAEFNRNTGALTAVVLHADKNVQTVTTSVVWRFNWAGVPVMSRY